MTWHYISFVDPTRPPGQRWLGGCYVDTAEPLDKADAAIKAVQRAYVLGCNPGGEAMILTLGAEEASKIPVGHKRVLLTREQIEGGWTG